jgi:hypothetical protein
MRAASVRLLAPPPPRWVREELTAADRAAYDAAWAAILARDTLGPLHSRGDGEDSRGAAGASSLSIGSEVSVCDASGRRGGALYDLAAAARRIAAAAAFAQGIRPGEREPPLIQRFPAAAAATAAAQRPAWTGICFSSISAEPTPAAEGLMRGAKAADSPGAGPPVDSLEVLLLQAAALSPLLRRKAADLAARVAAPAHRTPSPAAGEGGRGGPAAPALLSFSDEPPCSLEPIGAVFVEAAAVADVRSIERPPSLSNGGESLLRPGRPVSAASGEEGRRAAAVAGVGVGGGGVKGAARAMEKLLRSYECCPARLTDVCREVRRRTWPRAQSFSARVTRIASYVAIFSHPLSRAAGGRTAGLAGV